MCDQNMKFLEQRSIMGRGGDGDILLKEFFQKFWPKLLLQKILDRIFPGHQMPCTMHGEFASRNEINAICELAMKINSRSLCVLQKNVQNQ